MYSFIFKIRIVIQLADFVEITNEKSATIAGHLIEFVTKHGLEGSQVSGKWIFRQLNYSTFSCIAIIQEFNYTYRRAGKYSTVE